VILRDNDLPGLRHAEQVARALLPVAAWVKWVELPGVGPGRDVSDWLAAGNTAADLRQLVASAPIVTREDLAARAAEAAAAADDFVHRTIAVREGRVRHVEGLPKTDGSVRDVDMLTPVYEALRQHRAATWLRGDHALRNQEGRPIETTTLRRRIWYPALKRGGIRRRTMYQTRHTFATLMLATGENPEWIAKQLGHTSTQMLFQRYAKFIPNVTRRDGAAFLEAYKGWQVGQGRGDTDGGPLMGQGQTQGALGTDYDTCATPHEKRG
jgi:hypothetical protein